MGNYLGEGLRGKKKAVSACAYPVDCPRLCSFALAAVRQGKRMGAAVAHPKLARGDARLGRRLQGANALHAVASAGRTLTRLVPVAVVASERNPILNPVHDDCKRSVVHRCIPG